LAGLLARHLAGHLAGLKIKQQDFLKVIKENPRNIYFSFAFLTKMFVHFFLSCLVLSRCNVALAKYNANGEMSFKGKSTGSHWSR
jgi:hypothetical protein